MHRERVPGPDPAWQGRSFLAPGLMLFAGSGGRAGEHAHHAIQFVWGLDRDVEVEIGGRRLRLRATIIPAGLPHRFDAHGGALALALVDASGPRGARLERSARRLAGVDLTREAGRLPPPGVIGTAEQAVAWCGQLFGRLSGRDEPEPLSPAVERALAYLAAEIGGRPRLPDAARFAHVSPSRLTHAFSRQVGIPFRRFVLWLRVKRAVDEVCRGADLTEAAIRAGFSDSAHLTRTFRANFGLAPSALLHGTTLTGGFLDGSAGRPERSSPPAGP